MTEPRHGDPLDYPDIPGEGGLGAEYLKAVTPDHVREAIATRKTGTVRSDATAGRAGWVLIENEGALFRGPGRGNPMEVWHPGSGWTAYADAGRSRGVDWGEEISAAAASALMDDLENRRT